MEDNREERLQRAREELKRRFNANKGLQAQIEHAKKIAAETGEINYLELDDPHTLWSDGTGNEMFENTHECWDYLEKVGEPENEL